MGYHGKSPANNGIYITYIYMGEYDQHHRKFGHINREYDDKRLSLRVP